MMTIEIDKVVVAIAMCCAKLGIKPEDIEDFYLDKITHYNGMHYDSVLMQMIRDLSDE